MKRTMEPRSAVDFYLSVFWSTEAEPKSRDKAGRKKHTERWRERGENAKKRTKRVWRQTDGPSDCKMCLRALGNRQVQLKRRKINAKGTRTRQKDEHKETNSFRLRTQNCSTQFNYYLRRNGKFSNKPKLFRVLISKICCDPLLSDN